jgi:hypothetical protein
MVDPGSLTALDVHGRIAAQILAFASEYGVPLPDGYIFIPLRLRQTSLGHTTISVTPETYRHPLPGMDNVACGAIDEAPG